MGGGSSSKSRAPVESTDTLKSRATATILDLICEGEIEGLINGEQSIYLDETPILNADNSSNFTGVTATLRTGTQTQEYIKGIAESSRAEVAVDVQVKKSTGAITRTITSVCEGVKIRIAIPALQKYKDNGDINGADVRFQIYTKSNNGSFVLRKDETISGKASSRYEVEYYLSVEPPFPISIKVERISDDSTSQYLQNSTIWASYTSVIEAKFNYPNSVLMGLTFDAEQFSSIPSRAYDIKGLKVKIPQNATPRPDGSLSYDSTWNGTFKIAWTSDPAWCLYDLLTNSRYGAGVASEQIDKWSFLPISQYCSAIVDDGFGGTEPRFSLNCYIQTASDAYQLINALASVLRGMAYWAEGGITLVQDAPVNPVRQFNNANVVKFEYSGSAKRSRHTVALVTWNDPTDFYRQKVEMVEDREGILALGVRETAIAAFGCTSRGQAHRVGKWLLFSERMETDTVTFETGAEGIPVRPGEIILVGDTKRAGMRRWGRILSASTTSVVIDAPARLAAGETYELSVILPNGSLQKRTINNGEGSHGTLTTTSPFDTSPLPGSAWILSSTSLVPQMFRAIGVTEVESHRYKITALIHYPSKYDAIENNLALEILPTRSIPSVPPNGVRNLSAGVYFIATPDGRNIASIRLSWERPILQSGSPDPFTVSYVAQIRRDPTESWMSAYSTTPAVDFSNVLTDYSYQARVKAVDSIGSSSNWVTIATPIEVSYQVKNLVAAFNNANHSIFKGIF